MNKLTVLFCIAAAFPAFGDFCIVKDGKPAAAIVWGEKPVKSAQMGAYELQHHVRMMTGAVLPIVKNRTGAGNLNIIQIGGENDDREQTKKISGKSITRITGLFPAVNIITAGHYMPYTIFWKNTADFAFISSKTAIPFSSRRRIFL